MNLLFCFLFLFNQRTPFYESILKDHRINSSYVVVKVNYHNQIYDAVIPNRELYGYFKLTKHYNEETYRREMLKILLSKSIIDLEDNLFTSSFSRVSNCSEIDSVAKLGKESFLTEYFDKNVIKNGYSIEKEYCIIRALFELGLFVYNDCESGALLYKEKIE